MLETSSQFTLVFDSQALARNTPMNNIIFTWKRCFCVSARMKLSNCGSFSNCVSTIISGWDRKQWHFYTETILFTILFVVYLELKEQYGIVADNREKINFLVLQKET